jgi:membrane associated rhomboid family serine protease
MMKAFFRALVSNIIFAAKIVLGFYVTVWLVRLLESPAWQNTAAQASLRLPFVNNLKTAVIVVGGLFVATWSLRFLDRTFFREQLKSRYSLKSGAGLNIGNFFTSSLIHLHDDHLYNNTRPLLLFAAIAVLLTPDFQAFFLVTAVIILVHGAGVWLFGTKGSAVVGASGVLLGYYSFDVIYGLAYPSWRNVVAILLLIFRGRIVWYNLRYPHENTSISGHLWGFFSGILAALWLVELGLT